MPRDNARRVLTGATALSPNLGERMMAAKLLDRSVVIRELMPHGREDIPTPEHSTPTRVVGRSSIREGLT
jgi:hypothetical protein